MEAVRVKDNFWLKGIFHGFSQVVLMENLMSGLLIFAAILVVNAQLGLMALVACCVGTGTAVLLKLDKDAITSGLFGFSPVLVGIAAGTFLTGATAWGLVLVGGFLAVPLTVIINKILGQAGLAGLTFPFIVVTWLGILVSLSSSVLNSDRSGSLATAVRDFSGSYLLPDILLKGVGEIFLLDHNLASFLILVAFFVAGLRQGLLAVTAILVSLFLGTLLGAPVTTLALGLVTYNMILTFLALDLFMTSQEASKKIFFFSFGAILTAVFDLAFGGILATFALPTLTFPFVVATWLTLYFEKIQTAKEA